MQEQVSQSKSGFNIELNRVTRVCYCGKVIRHHDNYSYCSREHQKYAQGMNLELSNNNPEVKKKKKEYAQLPETKERLRKYFQRPEVKQRIKEYRERPEVIERKKEYLQRPEVKKKYREYHQRPDVIERRKKYYQENIERLQKKNREAYHKRKQQQK